MFKSVSQLLFLSGTGVACQFLFLKLMASYFPGQLGAWATLEAFVALATAISVFGGEYSLINRLVAVPGPAERGAILRSQIAAIFALNFIIVSPVFIVLAMISGAGWDLRSVALVFLCSVCNALLLCFALYFRATRDFCRSGVVERIYAVVLLAVVALVVALFVTIDMSITFDAPAIAAASALVSLGVGIYMVRCDPNLEIRGPWLTGIKADILSCLRTKGARHVTATNILIFVYERVDQLLIGWLVGLPALAVYFVCYKVSFFVRFFTKSTNQVFFTYISRSINSAGRKQRDYPSANHDRYVTLNFRVNACVAFVFCLFSVLFSQDILSVFNPGFRESAMLLEVLSLALFFSVPNQVYFNFINASAGGSKFLSNSVVTIIVQLGFIGGTFWAMGLYSIVFARLIAVLVGNFNAVRYYRSLGGELRGFAPFLVLGVFLCLLVFVRYLIS